MNLSKTQGIVHIVGAGPGEADLLTVKAARVIGQAQAVVYDRLVGAEILALIPKSAMRIFAGKSCKLHVMTQDEINETLVSLARAGKRVVRLKGGDPLLFGRGGEEAEFCAQAGVRFEIVPGVTSASGCASYAGIPLTHRGLATGVRYVTGHSTAGTVELNWASLADPATTLVIYMGLANAQAIAQKLIEHGLPPETPAAAIEQGTTGAQKLVISTLARLHEDVRQAALEPPALIIIGKVVSLAPKLQWFTPAAQTSNAPSQSQTLAPR